MSDLISRSALLKALEEDKKSICSHVYGCINPCDADDLEFELEWVIYNQPTAYDVDKVVEELKDAVHFIRTDKGIVGTISPATAIEIVRKGGVE